MIQAFLGLPNSFILFEQGLNLPWNTAEFSCSSASGPGGTQSGKSPSLTSSVDKVGPLLLLSVQTIVQEERGRTDTEQRTWNDPTSHASIGISLQATQDHMTETCYRKNEDGRFYKPPVKQRPSADPCISKLFSSNSGFFILLHQKTKYFPLSPTPSSPTDIVSPWRWTKSHYLIGKAIWYAASRQQLQCSVSLLGLLCHNLNVVGRALFLTKPIRHGILWTLILAIH